MFYIFLYILLLVIPFHTKTSDNPNPENTITLREIIPFVGYKKSKDGKVSINKSAADFIEFMNKNNLSFPPDIALTIKKLIFKEKPLYTITPRFFPTSSGVISLYVDSEYNKLYAGDCEANIQVFNLKTTKLEKTFKIQYSHQDEPTDEPTASLIYPEYMGKTTDNLLMIRNLNRVAVLDRKNLGKILYFNGDGNEAPHEKRWVQSSNIMGVTFGNIVKCPNKHFGNFTIIPANYYDGEIELTDTLTKEKLNPINIPLYKPRTLVEDTTNGNLYYGDNWHRVLEIEPIRNYKNERQQNHNLLGWAIASHGQKVDNNTEQRTDNCILF